MAIDMRKMTFNFKRWVRRRDWFRLLWATPAILVTLGVLVFIILYSRQKAGDVAAWYMNEAKAAEEKQEEKQALSYAEMAVRTTPKAIEALKLVARLSQKTNHSRSLAIYQDLTAKGRGDADAHMMIANDLEVKFMSLAIKREQLRQKRFNADQLEEFKKAKAEDEAIRLEIEKVQKEYEDHLKLAASTHNQDAIYKLGRQYCNTSRFKEAVDILGRANKTNLLARHFLPKALYMEAEQILAKDKDNALALKEKEEARRKALELSKDLEIYLDDAENKYDRQRRFLLIENYFLLEKYADMITTLEEGIRLIRSKQTGQEGGPDPAAKFIEILGTAYSKELDRMKTDPKTTPAERFELLEKALTALPQDQRLLGKILDIVDPKSPEGKKAKDILEHQLVDGKNIGMAHFVLGTMAIQEGDDKKGIYHLEESIKTGRMGPETANNLAWLLASTREIPPATRAMCYLIGGPVILITTPENNKKNLDRALALIDSAIKVNPRHPEFHHTRGVVLFKMAMMEKSEKTMNQFKDARTELENTLGLEEGKSDKQPSKPRPETHLILGVIYEKLEDKGVALKHFQQAAKEYELINDKLMLKETLSRIERMEHPTPEAEKPKKETPSKDTEKSKKDVPSKASQPKK